MRQTEEGGLSAYVSQRKDIHIPNRISSPSHSSATGQMQRTTCNYSPHKRGGSVLPATLWPSARLSLHPDRLHWLSTKTHTSQTGFDCHSALPVLHKALFVSPSFNLINFTLMWDRNRREVWFNLLTDAWWVCAWARIAGYRVRSPSKTFQLLSSAKDSCILEPPKITSAMPINYRELVHTRTPRLWAPEILPWVP